MQTFRILGFNKRGKLDDSMKHFFNNFKLYYSYFYIKIALILFVHMYILTTILFNELINRFL